MASVPHHLLDVVSPKKVFAVSDFLTLGGQAIGKILKNGNIPIIVGGTGLYIDVLLGRMSIPEVPPNPQLRARLEKKSSKELFALLKVKDPARATTIEPQNPRRLIRALEIAMFKDRQTAPVRTSGSGGAAYDILWLGLNPGEKILHKKIHTRLLARLKQGMLAEARRLHAPARLGGRGLSYKRMEALGLEYRYLACYLQNKISREEMEEQLERAINKYAKRQMRWFKRNLDIHWVAYSAVGQPNKQKALSLAKRFLSI